MVLLTATIWQYLMDLNYAISISLWQLKHLPAWLSKRQHANQNPSDNLGMLPVILVRIRHDWAFFAKMMPAFFSWQHADFSARRVHKTAFLARFQYIKLISDNRAFRLIGQVLVGPEGARLSGIHCS